MSLGTLFFFNLGLFIRHDFLRMHVTSRNRPNSSLTVCCTQRKRHIDVPSGVSRANGDQPLLGTRMLQVRCNERIVLKHSLDFWDGNAMLLALLTIRDIPVKCVRFKRHSNKVLCKCIYKSIPETLLQIAAWHPTSPPALFSPLR